MEDNNSQHSATSSSSTGTVKQRSNIPSLVCAFSASLTTGGTTYAFGLYGAALKKTLHLSQAELDTISTAFFFAGLFSWIPGLCADKFGTRFALSLGGCAGSASLMTYWGVARQFLLVPRAMLVPALSALGIFIFLSCALVTGAVFKIIVASCGARTKGSAVGIAKGYVGLGAGLYTCMFESIRSPGETNLDFLPMASFFFLAAATLPALMLLPTKQQVEAEVFVDEATSLHFRLLYASLGAMATLIVGSSMADMIYGDTHSANNEGSTHYGMGVFLLSIWLGPIMTLLFIPRRQSHAAIAILEEEIEVEELGKYHDEVVVDKLDETLADTDDAIVDPLASNNTKKVVVPDEDVDTEEVANLLLATEDGAEDALSTRTEPQAEPNKNLVQMLQTPSALLMLWTTTILVGAGTVETNNMGQMVEALGFPDDVSSASLALFSVAQAATRVATGAISESALNWNTRSCLIDNGVPRPFFLVVASLVGFVAHLILAFAVDEIPFVFGAALSGAAFGMVWPLMVLIVGEVFGTANVGANYMFYDGFTSAAGTLMLSKIVAQDVYEQHIDPSAEDQFTCYGSACFKATHMVVALLSLTCVATSISMLYTSRHVYNKSNPHRS